MAEPMTNEELWSDEGEAQAPEEEVPTAEDVGEELPQEEGEEQQGASGPALSQDRIKAIEGMDPAALRGKLISSEAANVHFRRDADEREQELSELRELLGPFREMLERTRAAEEGEGDDLPTLDEDPALRLDRRLDRIEQRTQERERSAAEQQRAAQAARRESEHNLSAVRSFVPELAQEMGVDENQAFEQYQQATAGWLESRMESLKRAYPSAPQGAIRDEALAQMGEVTSWADARGMNRAKALFLAALDSGVRLGGGRAAKPNGSVRRKIQRANQRAEETRDPLSGGGSAGRPIAAKDIDRLPMRDFKKRVEEAGGFTALMQKLGKLSG